MDIDSAPNQTDKNTSLDSTNQIEGMKRTSKFAIFIISLILAISIPSGVFLLSKNQTPKKTAVVSTSTPIPTPTPDPTANWKTFESTAYPFSVKYPQNLSPEENISPFYTVVFRQIPVTQGEFSTYDLLAAPDTFQAKDPAGYDFIDSDTIHKLLGLGHNESTTIRTVIFKSTGQIIVGGQEATIFDVSGTDESVTHQKRVIFQKDKNNYVIVNWNGDTNQQEEFKKFLSTFKFTDQTSVIDTSNWKTFTNNENNFSIEYPSDWMKHDYGTGTTASGTQVYTVNFSSCDISKDKYCAMKKGQFSVSVDVIYPSTDTPEQSLKDNGEYSNQIEPITIGGKQGIFYNYQFQEAQGGWIFGGSVKNGDKIYKIDSGTTEDSERTNTQNLLKEFISTFKFTQ